MSSVCLTSTGGHVQLVNTSDMAEASVLKPFAYNGVVTSALVSFL